MTIFQHLTEETFQKYSTEIIELDRICFADSYWDINQWSRLFKNCRLNVLIKIKENEIQGFIAYSNIAGEAEIFKIGIHKTCRNQSIGQQLINSMIEQLKKESANIVFLEVRSDNKSAIKLYSKCQFKIINRRKNYYKLPDCDALVFQLKI